jgi:hypothetical protein
MFVRGDRAEPGATLAKQVVNSFDYWNDDSGKYLDLVFFGWYKDGDTVGFQHEAFIQARQEVENMSRWRYSGETDVLLVDFELPVKHIGDLWAGGTFSFRHCIWLPVEAMIRDRRVASLDALVHELVAAAKEVYENAPLQGSVFDVSDRIAWTRGRRVLWERLKKLLLRDWATLYDELRPFAVCKLALRASDTA